MYPGDGPVQAGLESFGFPPHFHDTLHTFPIGHVNALLAGTLDTGPPKELAAGKGICCFILLLITLSLILPTSI